jgi:hypothetical protein
MKTHNTEECFSKVSGDSTGTAQRSYTKPALVEWGAIKDIVNGSPVGGFSESTSPPPNVRTSTDPNA